MVSPRRPNHSKQRKRRKRTKPTVEFRVLLVPLLLAGLAIAWNILRLFRALFRPAVDQSTTTHREHAKAAEFWNYKWCKPQDNCQNHVALDLQDFLGKEEDEEFSLEEMVPDPQELRDLFEVGDDGDDNRARTSKNMSAMTDDLDAHPDRFGNLVVNSARFEQTLTPRVLVEARRNMTQHSSSHTNHLRAIQSPNNDHFALLSRRGLGESHFYNQDRAVLVDNFPVLEHKKQRYPKASPLHSNYFLGIFDGHGLSGHVKADYAAATLPKLLLERLSKYKDGQYSDAQIRRAFSSVFWQVHREGPLIHDSGCTASVIVRLQQHLYFANVGDSRSMLVRIDPKQQYVNITHITKPHKPNDPKERQRIVTAGCVVTDPIPLQDPTARVTESLESGMALAMSRSIGDYDLEHCGVTPEPTVTVVDLAKHNKSKHSLNPILLAVSISDGIMDAVSLQDVVQALAVPFWKPNTYQDTFASPLEQAAEDLIRTASDRWLMNTTFFPYRDDITIAVRRVQ